MIDVQSLFDPTAQTLTHIVGIPTTDDVLVIDPVLDYDASSSRVSLRSVDALLAAIGERRVHAILETHAHADHLSACRILAERLYCPVGIGVGIRAVQATFARLLGRDDIATTGEQFEHLLGDETVTFGPFRVRVIPTPGHTPGCVSYLIEDCVFTGDALFIEDYGTGRCDFPGGDAATLFQSVRERLFTLPGDTRVFPCHDYQPNGRALRTETTIRASRLGNVQLSEDTALDAFVAFRETRDRALPAPKLLWSAIQVNIDGGRLPRFLTIPLRGPA